jgi:hypothetical protein
MKLQPARAQVHLLQVKVMQVVMVLLQAILFRQAAAVARVPLVATQSVEI